MRNLNNILIGLCMFLVIIGTVTANYNLNVTRIYKLENLTDIANGWNLTNSGATLANAKNGQGYLFTANTNVLNGTGGWPNTRTNFSVFCWANTTSATGGTDAFNAIISTLNTANLGWSIGFSSSGKFFTYTIPLGANYFSTFTTNTWYHVGFTYDNTTSNLTTWINGVNMSTNITTFSDYGSNFTIGRFYNNAASSGFLGVIDECYTWNQTLSQTDITTLYNSGAGTFFPNQTTGGAGSVSLTYPVNTTHYDIGSGITANDYNGSIIITSTINATCTLNDSRWTKTSTALNTTNTFINLSLIHI